MTSHESFAPPGAQLTRGMLAFREILDVLLILLIVLVLVVVEYVVIYTTNRFRSVEIVF